MSLHPTAIVQPVQHWRKLSLSLTFGSPAKRSYRISSRAIFRVLRSAVFFFSQKYHQLGNFSLWFRWKKNVYPRFFWARLLDALFICPPYSWQRVVSRRCAKMCERVWKWLEGPKWRAWSLARIREQPSCRIDFQKPDYLSLENTRENDSRYNVTQSYFSPEHPFYTLPGLVGYQRWGWRDWEVAFFGVWKTIRLFREWFVYHLRHGSCMLRVSTYAEVYFVRGMWQWGLLVGV